MPDVINFVRDQRKRLTKLQVRDKLFLRYAAIVCGFSFALFIIVVSSRIYLSLQVKQLIERQDLQRAQIQAQESNERQYLLFAAKLEALSKLFINRRNKQEAINYFSTLFGADVLISSIKYDSISGELEFGLRTRNVFSLNEVIDTLRTPQVRDRFESLSFKDLSRTSSAEYQTNIRLTLK